MKLKCFKCKNDTSITTIDIFGITITCKSCGYKAYEQFLLPEIDTITEGMNCRNKYEFGVRISREEWDEIYDYYEKNK